MLFGCSVQLAEVWERHEGPVHVSQLRQEGRVRDVTDVVKHGQRVKVKVLSITGNKMSLSMKDVDQVTGHNLNLVLKVKDNEDRNPDRPHCSVTMLRVVP